jgi:ribosome-associated protein
MIATLEEATILSRNTAHDAQTQTPSSSLEMTEDLPGEVSLSDGDSLALETLITERLDEDKAQDIVCIDLRGKSSVADTLIIASGRSHRHVGALADHVLRTLKEKGFGKAKVEGLPACDWVLIDVGDVVVHLFRPEVRAFYNIEKIWSVSATGTGHAISTN